MKAVSSIASWSLKLRCVVLGTLLYCAMYYASMLPAANAKPIFNGIWFISSIVAVLIVIYMLIKKRLDAFLTLMLVLFNPLTLFLAKQHLIPLVFFGL